MTATLHVLTYNTHLFTGTLAATLGKVIGNVEYEDAVRLSGIMARLKRLRPDVVGLTEVWARKSQERFLQGLRALYPYACSDGLQGGLKVGSGLLLLSRHPLSNPTFTGYKALTGSDGWSQKGFMTATLNVCGVNVLVALTHTQASDGEEASQARWNNLLALKAVLHRAELAHLPMVVFGDLNVSGECREGRPTPEYQGLQGLLAEVRLTDAFRRVHSCGSARGITWDGENNPLVGYFDKPGGHRRARHRLDYLFARGLRPSACNVLTDFLYQTVCGGPRKDLSDHYPLHGAFTLPRS